MRLVEGRANIDDLDSFLTRLGAIGEEFDCAVQAFDARYVVGREHLESAVEHANRAFDRGENVARDPAVEILLYAAGRRQINQALEMGVSEGERPVVVAVDGGREGDDEREAHAAKEVATLLEPGEALGQPDRERVFEFFDISERELAATGTALTDLVCERVALLEVEK
ncbi:KEOPS complex subunit Cgi121 [Haladaptatus salinisoli]|uniref:KEOPS complex subunit Cgi121 n=1 Tax=Haladaptatus salinisoli TaxID=2884876 RepID=UPI001D0BBEA0|nr:KEOPS complex subunit Cgi121 [Haladaptatus salinisoli]